MPKLSPKHALTSEELKFCKVHVSLGGKNVAEAYARSHLRRASDGRYVEADRDVPRADLKDIKEYPEVTSKERSRRGKRLLRLQYIKDYCEELIQPTSDHARTALVDSVLFGDDGARQRAAEKIFAQEDKLGLKDATERFAQLWCEIGGTIRVPLPHRFQQTITVTCECGEETVVEIDEPIYAEAPVSEMFPQFAEGENEDDAGV